MSDQPKWAGDYSAVRKRGRWIIPLITERGARLVIEELQPHTNVRLVAVPDGQCWNVQRGI